MSFHLWLDDLRNPKDFGCPDYVWFTDPFKAMEAIRTQKIDKISFDHDLGVMDPLTDREVSGNDVAKVFEDLAFNGKLQHFPDWNVHSANPEGAKNIRATMESAGRWFERNCQFQPTNGPEL